MTLTLVGDPCQSIYLWRTSKTDLFLNHASIAPEGKIQQKTILKNYRTPKQLVEIANKFREQFVKFGLEHNPSIPALPEQQSVINFMDFDTAEEEMEAIIQEIHYLHKEYNIPYSKFSVLCRTNDELVKFEPTLVSHRIPYYFKFDSLSIMKKSGFRILYAIYTLMLDPANIRAFTEIITPIYGVGKAFLDKLKQYSNPGQPVCDRFCKANKNALPDKGKAKVWEHVFAVVDNILSPILSLSGKVQFSTLNREILQKINVNLQLEETKSFNKNLIRYGVKQEQLLEVFETIRQLYNSLSSGRGFQLLGNLEQFQEIYDNLQLSQESIQEKKEDKDALGFYTIHSYKGKENDYIYYSKVNALRSIDPHDFENNCVFYVAITRAKRRLVISGSDKVRSYDNLLREAAVNPFVELLKQII